MTFLYSSHPETLPDYAKLLPFIDHQPSEGVFLYHQNDGISLCKAAAKGQVKVDFLAGAAEYRRTKGGGELIAKAVNHRSYPIVWDATGGLGRDAFVLASLGLEVHVFEQHPAVFCLLADGLHRANQAESLQEIVKNIHLQYGNAIEAMPVYAQNHTRPDVIYLDPMYPERQKSAAVKKEMAYFHELLGNHQPLDEELLLNTARQIAKKRVVVKRPRLGVFLAQTQAAYQYTGKSTRFDVYLPFHAEIPEVSGSF